MPPTTNQPGKTIPLVTYNGDDPMDETIKSLRANQRLYGP
jgi:hypothetical protein